MLSAIAAGLLASAIHAQVAEPVPLHLTREIADSVSGKTTQRDEYVTRNGVVIVSGEQTAIVDLERSTITRIDRANGTWSIAPVQSAAAMSEAIERRGEVRRLEPATIAGRLAEVTVRESGERDARTSTRIAATAEITITQRQAEVLLLGVGAGSPHIVESLRGPGAAYRLPLEIATTVTAAGEVAEFRATVTRVAYEPPPADVLVIPQGARRVDPPMNPWTALAAIETSARR